MKKSRLVLRWLGLIFVVMAGWLLVVTVILPSSVEWSWSNILSGALTDARAVRLVEFTQVYEDRPDGKLNQREVVLQCKDATARQIADLRAATGKSIVCDILIRRAACFDPHHRVEVVRRDGSSFRCEICFGCHNFRFDAGHEEPLPGSWLTHLRQFFTAAGMPPHGEADYQGLAAKQGPSS